MAEVSVAAGRDDLCLAFVNTLSWRGAAAPVEALGDCAALLGWLAAAGAAPRARHSWLHAHPAEAAALHAAAIALREAIHGVCGNLAVGRRVRERDLAALNDALAAAPPRRRLARASGGFAWSIARNAMTAPTLLAPVLWSAGDLIAGTVRRRLRRCADERCLWLFLDASRSGTRRWCDMAACGNRAKARRHYLGTREE